MASAAQTGSPIPLLLIANRADENAIAAVMAAGANDYLLRPIRRPELLTRVHVLFRRAYPDWSERERIRFGPYTFDMATAHISCAGKPIEVTQKEFELALLFFRNLGRPLSRAYILDMVWSREGNVPSRTMDTHVSRVRSKLQLRPENGYRLTPVYSYGYRLEELQDTA
jgi:DNA-binding response OmpR family regulator